MSEAELGVHRARTRPEPDDHRADAGGSGEAAHTEGTGSRPAGVWGDSAGLDRHGLRRVDRTVRLLAEAGIRYVCDWPNDEQPYRMKVPVGQMVSLPVAVELDDVSHAHRPLHSHPAVRHHDHRGVRPPVRRRGGVWTAAGAQPPPHPYRTAVPDQVPRPGPRPHHASPGRVGGHRTRDRGLVREPNGVVAELWIYASRATTR